MFTLSIFVHTGIEQACFSSRHARDLDLSTPSCTQLLKERNSYGFGAVHYLRDVGDAAKIVAAIQAGMCQCNQRLHNGHIMFQKSLSQCLLSH
jgi:hypothetical protein